MGESYKDDFTVNCVVVKDEIKRITVVNMKSFLDRGEGLGYIVKDNPKAKDGYIIRLRPQGGKFNYVIVNGLSDVPIEEKIKKAYHNEN